MAGFVALRIGQLYDVYWRWEPETFHHHPVSDFSMKPNWTLRQLLALLRGVALMVALLWTLVLVQLVPVLVRGGLTGVHDHITRVATAGVPADRWDVAVTRMYEALGATLLLGILLFLVQRYLGRKLATTGRRAGQGMSYSNSSTS